MSEYEADRAAAFASQADRSRELAAGHLQQAIAVVRSMRQLRDNVNQLLSGWQVEFRWVDTRLDLMGPNGEWVPGPDLRGLRGLKGDRGPALELRVEAGVIESHLVADDEPWIPLLDIGQFLTDAQDARDAAVAARGIAEAAASAASGAAGDAAGSAGVAGAAASSADGARIAAEQAAQDAQAAAASIDVNNLLARAANLSDLADVTAARSNLGLGAVDNTADIDKPVSTATAAALADKADAAALAATRTELSLTAIFY